MRLVGRMFHTRRPPGLSSVGVGFDVVRRSRFSHPISHRTPHYRVGKDSIRLLVAIEKRLNFQTRRDRKIRVGMVGNSLGNRWRRVTGKRTGAIIKVLFADGLFWHLVHVLHCECGHNADT
jgi:hypothetical protein